MHLVQYNLGSHLWVQHIAKSTVKLPGSQICGNQQIFKAAKYNMTSCGMLPLLGLLAFLFKSGTSTSEFFIWPSANTPCPMRPCYTLSQVMDNPLNYFTSNTTVVFPPGYHEVSTEGQLVIQNVNNISLVGDSNDSTMIKCVGEFGLAFINITNLTIEALLFNVWNSNVKCFMASKKPQ